MTAIVDINKSKASRRRPRHLVRLAEHSGPARYYAKMQRDIEADLGGKRDLSRIEMELVRAFCGSATRLQYLNAQLLGCDAADCDLASYSQLTSNLVRISTRLGLGRRARDVTPTLADIMRNAQQADDAVIAEHADG
jgi:hypothetical protein